MSAKAVSARGRLAWFHCFAGVAGDMALASLLDAGADVDEVRSLLKRLPIDGWELHTEEVLRCGIAAVALRLVGADAVVRTFPAMRDLLERAALPQRVHDRSLAAFTALAETEARLHRKGRDEVHFHELSGFDTIIDIVGTMAALEVLDVDEVRSSAIATGTGTVQCADGVLPNPAPAVLALLKGAPLYGRDVPVELTTPTGAAIIATLATGFGPLPPLKVRSTGYGAGGREIEGLPNCTQVVIGEIADHDTSDGEPLGQPLALLETNLDDVTGEQIGDALAAVFSAGAHDAWVTPVLMKKGRPGQVLSVLGDVAAVAHLRQVIFASTGTFGVRTQVVQRYAAARHFESVEVDGQQIAVKVRLGRAKFEHDDLERAARALGQPVIEVERRALAIWSKDHS